MPYQHLFFDLDRTLWDMERNATETLCDLFYQFELDKKGVSSTDKFIEHYNHYNDLLWDRYRRKIIDKATLRALRFRQTLAHFSIHDKQLAHQFDEAYLAQAPLKNNLIPGALALLESLKDIYQIHIITNGFHEVQHHKINSSGLSPYLKTIITSEDCGYTKPDYRIFTHALKLTGGETGNSLMIGDDLHVDIVGAREAGWHQVYFNPDANPHSERVTYEINALKELKLILNHD
ncbi:MAG: noncanonical pyrimidine nucleotidase, YjjG family [Bacteroidetes bacterium]|nr:noncanonical pyrimidine nucleotidase, YjjG family [Bacteroidota bacterium]